jgi:hypothetical protein
LFCAVDDAVETVIYFFSDLMLGFEWRKLDGVSSVRVKLAVVLNGPASGLKLLVDLLAGELLRGIGGRR